ncbi:MAG TPA: type II toxin-antitoxin system VapC family toxin [Chthoniobacterales bacterium]|jgi:predicted nucleic acid-binding protein|nr:type II toxin-antitoxin system VapC family toxin [Chthoniobacterales bacterium]
MNAFADTSFLYALYRQQENSFAADAFVQRAREPVHVSSLVLFEFRQSARFQVFRFSKDRAQGFSKREAQLMLATLEENIASGAVAIVPVDWKQVHSTAEQLSSRYTMTGGHRALDILHAATAIHLKVLQFLTFDKNQSDLTKRAGLEVGP